MSGCDCCKGCTKRWLKKVPDENGVERLTTCHTDCPEYLERVRKREEAKKKQNIERALNEMARERAYKKGGANSMERLIKNMYRDRKR